MPRLVKRSFSPSLSKSTLRPWRVRLSSSIPTSHASGRSNPLTSKPNSSRQKKKGVNSWQIGSMLKPIPSLSTAGNGPSTRKASLWERSACSVQALLRWSQIGSRAALGPFLRMPSLSTRMAQQPCRLILAQRRPGVRITRNCPRALSVTDPQHLVLVVFGVSGGDSIILTYRIVTYRVVIMYLIRPTTSTLIWQSGA